MSFPQRLITLTRWAAPIRDRNSVAPSAVVDFRKIRLCRGGMVRSAGLSIVRAKLIAEKDGAYALSKSIATVGIPPNRIPGRHLRKAASWRAAPAMGYYWKLAHRAHRARKGAYGLGQYELLRGARSTVNIHAGPAKNFTANMRLFEATGIGTCLLTDASSDLAEFFEPDYEAVTFSSVAEAVEKARFLVDHPAEADKIAAKRHQRTLKDHTFAARAPILLEAFKTFFERRKPA